MIENTRAWKMTISTALSLKVIMTRFVRALARLRQRSLNNVQDERGLDRKVTFSSRTFGLRRKKESVEDKMVAQSKPSLTSREPSLAIG